MDKNNINGIIYKAIFPNNKIYIGQTIKTLKKRKIAHKVSAITKKSILAVHNAIRKFGWDNVKWIIIENNINSIDKLNQREEYWINYYNSIAPNGYNLKSNGDNHLMSDETKLKLRNANLGKKMSEDTKRKISIGNTGKIRSKETRRKMAISKIGNNHSLGVIKSEKTRKKLSIANTGKKHSEETKKKISNANKGKLPWNKGIPCSEQTKEKLRKMRLGKKHSEKTKKKISEISKRNYLLGLLPMLNTSKAGKNNPFYGKTHSRKTRKKISLKVNEYWKNKKGEKNECKINC